MDTKVKISIVALMIGVFIAGGLALNALKSDAFWGLRRGEEMSEEMKAEMQEHREAMEELRNSDEWQEADMEQRREMMQELCENEECPPPRMGHKEGLLMGFMEGVDREVITLDNGIQITVTSDDSEIVEKLHNMAEKINSLE